MIVLLFQRTSIDVVPALDLLVNGGVRCRPAALGPVLGPHTTAGTPGTAAGIGPTIAEGTESTTGAEIGTRTADGHRTGVPQRWKRSQRSN